MSYTGFDSEEAQLDPRDFENNERARVDSLIASAGDLTIRGQEELAAEVVRLRALLDDLTGRVGPA